jgi:nucleoside-diphosphate-sugar epimerase
MNVLITGGASRLAREIVTALAGEHQFRLMDRVAMAPPQGAEFVQGDLLEPRDVWLAIRGMQAVIHTAAPPPDLAAPGLDRDHELLELGTRGTHVLLSAAVEAGVRRVVYAGTLGLFRAYAEDITITENWQPLPSLDMAEMSNYLGELGCREFAFGHRLTATSLRLGTLVVAEEVAGQPVDPSWLDVRDAAQAFGCALKLDASDAVHAAWRWNVIHVCAAHPKPRFLIDAARGLGFAPGHDFTSRDSAAEEAGR